MDIFPSEISPIYSKIALIENPSSGFWKRIKKSYFFERLTISRSHDWCNRLSEVGRQWLNSKLLIRLVGLWSLYASIYAPKYQNSVGNLQWTCGLDANTSSFFYIKIVAKFTFSTSSLCINLLLFWFSILFRLTLERKI